MLDELYDRADELIDDDNFEEAIPLLKKSLIQGNFDSAYRLATIYLDCFEELGLEEPDFDTAIQYLQTGAFNNHSECQKELGLLLANSKYKGFNPIKAVKWILTSNDYSSEKDVKRLNKLIEFIYSKASKSTLDYMKSTIQEFSRFTKLTNNKMILTPLFTSRNQLIRKACVLALNNVKSIEELDLEADYFKKYFDKDFMASTKENFAITRLKLFMSSCKSVQDAIEFLLQANDSYSYYHYDYKMLEPLYMFIASSYRDGKNGVSYNLDEAINYFAESKTQLAISEKDDMVFNACNQFIQRNEYEKAKKYLPKIQSFNQSLVIKNKIEEHEKILYFEFIKKQAETGDYSASLKLAELYEKGYGVATYYDKAIAIYLKLFDDYHTQEPFDALFKYYSGDDNNRTKLKELLKTALEYKLQFDYNQERAFRELVASYATSYYEEVHTKGLNEIDTEGNIIYYLFDYYKKWWVDNYPNNQFYKDNFFAFIAVKKRNYNQYSRTISFPAALCNFFKLLSGDWVICTAPGHEKTNNSSNGVSDIINMVYLKSNFNLRNTLIQRTYTVDKKATANSGRNNNYIVDMQSLSIESGYDVKGKSIIVVDDITTSGSTLIACKNLLMNAGAKRVVLVALGKTKEPMYGF